jgi:hypothetical protein
VAKYRVTLPYAALWEQGVQELFLKASLSNELKTLQPDLAMGGLWLLLEMCTSFPLSQCKVFFYGPNLFRSQTFLGPHFTLLLFWGNCKFFKPFKSIFCSQFYCNGLKPTITMTHLE